MLLLALSSAQAQGLDRAGIYLLTTYEPISTVEWSSLNKLFRSYGAEFAQYGPAREVTRTNDGETFTTLERADPNSFLPPLSFDKPFSFGAGLLLMSLNAELLFQNLDTSSSATFEGGFVRTYEIDGSAWRLQLGLLGPVAGIDVGGFIGMVSSHGELLSYGTYPDGTVSFGDDSQLNGVWELGSLGVSTGLKVMVPLGMVRLYGSAEWLDPFDFAARTGRPSTGVRQNAYGTGPTVNSDVYTFVDTLPTDVNNFKDILMEGDEPVLEVYDGFKLNAGLVIYFGG